MAPLAELQYSEKLDNIIACYQYCEGFACHPSPGWKSAVAHDDGILNRSLPELPRYRLGLYDECTRLLLGRWKVDEAMRAIPQLRGYALDTNHKSAMLSRLA